jgi:sarcosine oxidase subunit beta
VIQAYARSARRAGVELNEQIQATGIDLEKGRVAAVTTTEGRISTGLVVNAAGARAREVGLWGGLDLPINNFKRHIFVTGPFPEIPDDTPFVEDMGPEWYFRKEGPGILMGMGKEGSTSDEPLLDWEFQDSLIEAAVKRVPILAGARILRGWAGLRPLTPDDLPILGYAPGLQGFVNCCGWGGHGVMHAPVGGRLIAELIADGRTSMNLSPYRLERFMADAD